MFQHDYIYKTKILRVIDGDTYEVMIDLGFKFKWDTRIRLKGVDTWEIRGPEKTKGILAKNFVRELFDEQPEWIWMQTFEDEQGKYGRYLADFIIHGLWLTDILREAGHVKVV